MGGQCRKTYTDRERNRKRYSLVAENNTVEGGAKNRKAILKQQK